MALTDILILATVWHLLVLGSSSTYPIWVLDAFSWGFIPNLLSHPPSSQTKLHPSRDHCNLHHPSQLRAMLSSCPFLCDTRAPHTQSLLFSFYFEPFFSGTYLFSLPQLKAFLSQWFLPPCPQAHLGFPFLKRFFTGQPASSSHGFISLWFNCQLCSSLK